VPGLEGEAIGAESMVKKAVRALRIINQIRPANPLARAGFHKFTEPVPGMGIYGISTNFLNRPSLVLIFADAPL
jgi:hypothetical protein